MILSTFQFLSCLALLSISIWEIFRGNRLNRFLLPSIVAASGLGIALIAPYLLEIFIIKYSGAIYEMEGIGYRINGPYWWVYYLGAILPLLPILALIPRIKRRPLIVATLALLGMVPSMFSAWQDLAFG